MGSLGNRIDTREGTEITVSRRSLVKMALGSLIALPAVAGGGFVLPFASPEKAYAATGEVVVAKADEIGIVVMDMGGGGKKPISGARVKVKSCFNNKAIEGASDSRGVAKLKITDLAEDDGKRDTVARYEFDAEIEVTKSGYRVFRTGRVRIKGAHGLAVPTRTLEAGAPYPSRATFDDWDVLYTGNEFVQSSQNDLNHKLVIELENVGANSEITLGIYANNKLLKALVNKASSSGAYSASLTALFLKAGHEEAIPVNAKLSVRFMSGGKQYSFPLAMKVASPANGVQAPGLNRNFSLTPFVEAKAGPGSHQQTQITLPSGLPLIGGQKLQLWKPELPVDVAFDPFGYVYCALRTSEWGYKSKNGKVDGAAWKSHPRASFKDQYDKVSQDAATMAMKTGMSYADKKGFMKSVDLTRTIAFTVNGQVSFLAKWGEKEQNLYRGRLAAQLVLGFDFNLAWQLLLGPVPVVLQFGLNASATAAIACAFSTTELFKWSNYALDYANSGFSITFTISPSISVGLGVKGLLTVSVKGVLTLTIFMGMGKLPANAPAGVSNPHIVVGIASSTNLVFQFLFATVPFDLPFKMNKPDWYNNWKNSLSGQGLDVQEDEENNESTDTAKAFMDALEDAYVMDDDDFGECLETTPDESFTYEYEINFDGDTGTPDGGYTGGGSWDEFVEFEGEGTTGQEVTGQEADSPTGESADGAPGALVAGSSSVFREDGLSVQSAPPVEPKIVIGPDPTYEGVVRTGYSTRIYRGRMGVGSAAGLIGLKAPFREKFATNVVGDPHVKVLKIFDNLFVFRIGSTKVKAQGGSTTYKRTRVFCEGPSDKSGNKRKTFMFEYYPTGVQLRNALDEASPINRWEYYDYDYDVIAEEKSDGTCDLHFFVISGKRDFSSGSDVKTKIAAAASDLVFCYMNWTITLTNSSANAKFVRAMGRRAGATQFDAACGGTNFPYHAFACPQITPIEDSYGNVKSKKFVLSYLDRAGKAPLGILSQKKSDVKVGLGIVFVDVELNMFNAYKNTSNGICSDNAKFEDLSVFEAHFSKRVKTDGNGGWHLVSLAGANQTYYWIIKTNAAVRRSESAIYSTIGGEHKYYYVPEVVVAPQLFAMHYDKSKSNPGLPFAPARLIEWPKHEGFLGTMEGKLVRANLQVGSSASFTYDEIGPKNLDITAFGTDDTGAYLYYPASRQGVPGYTYDASGNGKANKAVEEHYIMACKLYGTKFTDPFVFAEVDYDMDTLTAVSTTKEASMAFLSTNLKDARKGIGDIWFTGMPHVRCGNVIGMECLDSLVFAGMPAKFNVTVRNDGNVHLAGFTAVLRERDDSYQKAASSTKVVFSKDNLVESSFNPRGADGTLQNAAPDFSLAPGKTSIYQVELMIPSGWSDETQVSITGSDFVTAKATATLSGQSSGLSAQEVFAQADDEDYEDYIVDYIVDDEDYPEEDEEYPYDVIEVLYDDEVVGDELFDAPLDGADGSGNSLSNVGTPMPKLNDPLNNLDIAAMAAAGLGAAFASYSNRRVENERAAEEGDESAS